MRLNTSMPASASEEKTSEGMQVEQPTRQADADIEQNAEKENEDNYPSFKVVLLATISINLAFFLVALDRTIIGVAIPHISNEFHSFGQIAWYESAFFLTTCAFQLPMGRVYTFYASKWVFLSTIVIFEIGSIVCAASPTSPAFIVGRAIAGIGGAGSFVGATTIIAELVPLQSRPKYLGLLGAVFGLASIAGPLLGGVFTSKATWRWCFWINVPIGGVALLVLLFCLPTVPPRQESKKTFLSKLNQLDPIGTSLVIPAISCLVLALQWGGVQYPWNDARIVALLVLGIVLLMLFAVVQAWQKEKATLPPRIFRQRSIIAAFFAYLGLSSGLVIVAFYLPIRYQVVQGYSAVDAGIRMLPYFLSTVIFVIGSGFGISLIGYYTPFIIAGTMILIVGLGLLSSLDLHTETGKLIGYQIVIGAGTGLSLQQGINAANTVLEDADIPIGLTALGFAQSFGGSIFIAVCQTILTNTLTSSLEGTITGFHPSSISNMGATQIRNSVPANKLPVVLTAYNSALVNVFYCGLGLAGLSFVSSLFLEWKTVKKTAKQ